MNADEHRFLILDTYPSFVVTDSTFVIHYSYPWSPDVLIPTPRWPDNLISFLLHPTLLFTKYHLLTTLYLLNIYYIYLRIVRQEKFQQSESECTVEDLIRDHFDALLSFRA